MSKVEAVKKAIWESRYKHTPVGRSLLVTLYGSDVSWEEAHGPMFVDLWDTLDAEARAAIEAMREPTGEMTEAFYRAYERPLSPDRWENPFSNGMEAMIDAALKETP